MATNFPTGLDNFNNPTAINRLNDPGVVHSEQHSDANDAIEKIQQVIGVTGSTDPATITGKLSVLIGGSGAPVGNALPLALGVPNPGTSVEASRIDHVHKLPTTADIGAASVLDLAGKANITHAHNIADVIGLQTALDGKQPTGTYATVAYVASQNFAQLSSLDPEPLGAAAPGEAVLASRSDHIHPLPTAADIGAASLSNATPVGLSLASPGTSVTASRSDHIHPLPTLPELGAASIVQLSGKADISHSHTISNVTGLQVALDSKQPVGSYATSTDVNTAISTHVAATDPHSQYTTTAEVNSLIATTPHPIMFAVSDETAPLTVGTNKVTIFMPSAYTVATIKASLTTAQTSGSVLSINVKASGVSILSSIMTFTNGSRLSSPATLVRSNLLTDEVITIDVTQVGSSANAAGLKITFLGYFG